ncbi:hypothetical protein [Helicobacter sp. T3_23-1059]
MNKIDFFATKIIGVDMQDINNITKNSNIAFLNALYQCQDFIIIKSNQSPSLNDDNIISHFGYHSSFYLSFIANKDSLSDSYLTSRKSLYKSIMQIKEQKAQAQKQEIDSINAELKDLDFTQREARLQEIQKEQKTKIRETQKQDRFNQNAKSTNDLIFQTNDKTNTIIFLDSNGLALKSNSYNNTKSNPNSQLDSSVDSNLNTNLI